MQVSIHNGYRDQKITEGHSHQFANCTVDVMQTPPILNLLQTKKPGPILIFQAQSSEFEIRANG